MLKHALVEVFLVACTVTSVKPMSLSPHCDWLPKRDPSITMLGRKKWKKDSNTNVRICTYGCIINNNLFTCLILGEGRMWHIAVWSWPPVLHCWDMDSRRRNSFIDHSISKKLIPKSDDNVLLINNGGRGEGPWLGSALFGPVGLSPLLRVVIY